MDKIASEYGVLLTIAAAREDAEMIAKALVGEKFAACVQLVPIESFYRWQGELANEREYLLLVKTKTALFDEAIQAIKAVHPYETPEIVGMNFTAGFAGYFSWIDEVTR